jgi:predicted peptidase
MKPTNCFSLIIIVLLISICFSCKKENAVNNTNNDITETLPLVQTAVSIDLNANCAGFYKAIPAHYNSTTKKYPLLIFLHGSGETGNGTTDLPKVLNNAVPNLIKNQTFPASFVSGDKNYSFIVISPQFKGWPSPADVNAVIGYSIDNFRIDETRIYVTGLSMGGGATWDYAALYARKIAAIVSICGASAPNMGKAKNIADSNLPVWAFHNENDNTVPVNSTKDYISMINSFNSTPPAKMTLWPTGGHNAWTKATDPTYKEDNINMYEWMLQYHR